MSILSYQNSDGNIVYTSHYLKKRGTCCNSFCLHCPYGLTLKKFKIEFEEVNNKDISELNKIVKEDPSNQSDLTQNLLNQAFGDSKIDFINRFNYKDFKKLYLKKVLCGVCKLKNNLPSKLYLKEHFRDQGIDLDLLTQYMIS